jgi:hypothetical protein
MTSQQRKGAPAPTTWTKYRTPKGWEFVLVDHTPESWAADWAMRLDRIGGVTSEYVEELCDDVRAAEPTP